MSSKNFIIKNGLTVGTTEVIDSSGDLTAAAFNTAAKEVIDDQVNTLLTAGTGVSLTYDDAAGTLTINGQQGDITGVNAGAGLTGTATSGDATLNIGAGTGITVNADDIAINFKDEDNMASDSATHAATQQSIKAYVDAQVATVPTGDITSVVSGTGLTGGGTSGDVTVNAVGGTGITVNADDIEIDTSVVTTLTGTQTLTNKTLTTPIINGTVSGTAVKDEDDMTSNSSTHLASQQSIKAYVDAQVATKDNTDEITEGSTNLYFTNARADARIANAIKDEDNMASDSATHVPSQQSVKAFVTAQLATKDNTDEITEGSSNLYFTNERVDDRVDSLLTAGSNISLTYDDAAGTLTIAGQAGDITSVVAGSGLTGGGTSGDATLNVIGGDGITANANDIALSSTVAGDGLAYSSGVVSVNVDDSSIETDSDSLQVKAGGVTNAMLAGSIAAGKLAGSIGNAKLSNSAITIDGTSVSLGGSITTNNTQLTQENVEDFVGGMLDGTETGISVSYDDTNGNLDFVIGDNDITNDMLAGSINQSKLAGSIANSKLANSSITIDGQSVALGGSVSTTNTQLSTENVEDIVGGMLDGTETGISVSYDDTDGNLDFVVADSDFALTGDVTGSVTQTAKGNVSIATTIAANSVALGTDTTGNYIAAVSAGTGVSVSGSGEGATSTVSIGQAVGTSSNVEFANLVLSGNLTVNGSTVTNSSTNTTIEDQLIELGTGNSGSASGDAGIVIERGSDANVFLGWDESADAITFGTGTFTGASSGNLTITPSAVNTGALTITNATNSGGTARNIHQSTSAPGGSDGAVGDLWILYS